MTQHPCCEACSAWLCRCARGALPSIFRLVICIRSNCKIRGFKSCFRPTLHKPLHEAVWMFDVALKSCLCTECFQATLFYHVHFMFYPRLPCRDCASDLPATAIVLEISSTRLGSFDPVPDLKGCSTSGNLRRARSPLGVKVPRWDTKRGLQKIGGTQHR